jgi:hypothetical protein
VRLLILERTVDPHPTSPASLRVAQLVIECADNLRRAANGVTDADDFRRIHSTAKGLLAHA